jgi:hypothetical protein
LLQRRPVLVLTNRTCRLKSLRRRHTTLLSIVLSH